MRGTFSAPVVLLSGPADVGKTQLLNQLFQRKLEEVELVAELDRKALEQAIKDKNPALLWPAIVQPIQHHRERQRKPLTRVAVAHAMNARPSLLVIEDLHSIGPAGATISFVQAYLEKYHAGAPQLRRI